MEVEVNFPPVYKDIVEHIYNRDRRIIVEESGRAGGKTKNISEALILTAMAQKTLICAGRELENTTTDSVHRAFESAIEDYNFPGWKITDKRFKYKNGSEIIFKGLRTSSSKGALDAQRIKSLEGVDIFWGEEAQSFSTEALEVLIPTIRKKNSMLIFSANRIMTHDPYRQRLVEPHIGINNLPDSKPFDNGRIFIQKINSYDIEEYLNPETIEEREDFRMYDPEAFRHVWDGEPLSEKAGGIFSKQLAEARNNSRIGDFPYRSNYDVYAAFDLGVSDSTAIWLYQVIDGAIYFINYIEDFGRPIANYFMDLKDLNYHYGDIYLPHDAEARSNRSGSMEQAEATTLLDDLKKMLPEFRFKVLPRNIEYRGIDIARNLFSTMYFDAKGCELGLQRLGGYAYEYSVKNKIWSKHPKHDENSHGADAFQYACMSIQTIKKSFQNGNSFKFKVFVPKAFSDYK